MTRSVPEWIGKSDDTPAPPRVRLRVFERFDGMCQLTGIKIRPGDAWDCDHEIPLIQGGENREGNLRPVLRNAHREKTANEVHQKAKEARVKRKHLGLHQSKTPLPGGRNHHLKRKIGGGVVRRDSE